MTDDLITAGLAVQGPAQASTGQPESQRESQSKGRRQSRSLTNQTVSPQLESDELTGPQNDHELDSLA